MSSHKKNPENNKIIDCECGVSYKLQYKSSHIRCTRHLNYTNNVKVVYPNYSVSPHEEDHIICECACTIQNNINSKKQHENTYHHNRYMQTPKGESFCYYLTSSGVPSKFKTKYVQPILHTIIKI